MEELVYMVLGIAMIYTIVHTMVIVITKTKDTSSYEKAVMILCAVFVLLLVIGSTA